MRTRWLGALQGNRPLFLPEATGRWAHSPHQSIQRPWRDSWESVERNSAAATGNHAGTLQRSRIGGECWQKKNGGWLLRGRPEARCCLETGVKRNHPSRRRVDKASPMKPRAEPIATKTAALPSRVAASPKKFPKPIDSFLFRMYTIILFERAPLFWCAHFEEVFLCLIKFFAPLPSTS